MDLAIFDLQVTLLLPTKFQVNCLSLRKRAYLNILKILP